jgi:hypothetical protein
MDGDEIAIPPESSMHEFFKNVNESPDNWECTNDWVRKQFRNNEPKEETEDDLAQRMFRFMDNGLHYSGKYHTGKRIAAFLCSNNGLIGNVARNKLERIMIDFFFKQWYQMAVCKKRIHKSLWIHCKVWGGKISIKCDHVLSWKPSTIAQYIWRKLFQATWENRIPDTVLNMINEIAAECDYDDIYLANATFVLNSKCGLLWGGYTHTEDAEFEYCYQERFIAERYGSLVEIKDITSKKYRYLPYGLLQKPSFNLVNWWRSDKWHSRQKPYLQEQWFDLSESWALLENGSSSN